MPLPDAFTVKEISYKTTFVSQTVATSAAAPDALTIVSIQPSTFSRQVTVTEVVVSQGILTYPPSSTDIPKVFSKVLKLDFTTYNNVNNTVLAEGMLKPIALKIAVSAMGSSSGSSRNLLWKYEEKVQKIFTMARGTRQRGRKILQSSQNADAIIIKVNDEMIFVFVMHGCIMTLHTGRCFG